jgi:hypothetical protein
MDIEKQDDHAFQYEVFIPEVSKALKIVAIPLSLIFFLRETMLPF